jgi:hypothetical protein
MTDWNAPGSLLPVRCFNFASPANRVAFQDNLALFGSMLRAPAYSVLLGHRDSEVLRTKQVVLPNVPPGSLWWRQTNKLTTLGGDWGGGVVGCWQDLGEEAGKKRKLGWDEASGVKGQRTRINGELERWGEMRKLFIRGRNKTRRMVDGDSENGTEVETNYQWW